MLRQPFVFLLTELFLLLSFLPIFVPRLNKCRIALYTILFLSITSLGKAYNASEEKTLAFSSEAYFGHWDKVIRLNKNNDYPTYLSAYYTNLAYARQGKLCDELMQHYQPASHGLLLQINNSTGYIYGMASPDALMECGDMAQAQHSAMLAMTFTPHQRSSRMIRKLTEIAIINEDYAIAQNTCICFSTPPYIGNGQKNDLSSSIPANVTPSLTGTINAKCLLNKTLYFRPINGVLHWPI